MSPPSSCWQALCESINRSRQSPAFTPDSLANSLLQRLRALGNKGHCTPNVIGWLQKINGQANRTQITFKRADSQDNRGRPALRLASLSHLRDGAVLALSLELDAR